MTREDWNPRPGARPRGGLALAAVLLLLSGAWQVFIGYSIAVGEALVSSGGGYWHRDDGAAWGWFNLNVGLAAIALSVPLAAWARGGRRSRLAAALAVGAASVAAVGQFFLVPQYPLWSTAAIAADVLVVWAVAARAAVGEGGPGRGGNTGLGPCVSRGLAT